MPRLAAVRASPFINMLAGAFLLRERVSTGAAFGGEVGVFAHERFRAGARALVPVASVNDEISAPAENGEASVWLWGLSVGAAANRQDDFSLSPSLQYMHIAGGDFGDTFGFLVPFEWLTRSGLRIGFDFSLVYGFGGKYSKVACPLGTQCVSPTQDVDRPNSAGFGLNFFLGHVFRMPNDSGVR